MISLKYLWFSNPKTLTPIVNNKFTTLTYVAQIINTLLRRMYFASLSLADPWRIPIPIFIISVSLRYIYESRKGALMYLHPMSYGMIRALGGRPYVHLLSKHWKDPLEYCCLKCGPWTTPHPLAGGHLSHLFKKA